ncbi:phage major capsid protein [Eisenbergiella porci]|uniref:phage major capsid protein n=1 Tax=Eisenbergiella porci TaxID=2652274 RepID=UPI002A90FF21|nr:phage major capsid protein [Eisenbergiella porci]MDY5528730.1 phage major capsid protein [Eisenbergiella porci]
MTREELMKMSKKDLKARIAALNKDAQAKSGDELQAIMDEAKEISGILADIASREALAGMVEDGTEDPTPVAGQGEEGMDAKNQARTKSGKALKDGKAVSYQAKTLARPMNTLTTSTGVVMPKHTSPDIAPTFNNVSSLIDRVKTVPLPGGESYQRPFVKSYGDGAGSTAEGADYNTSEPEFGYAEIVREKITAYAEEPEEMQKLPDADYDGVVEESVVRAIKRYASRQILVGPGGTGKFRGIFFNPSKAQDDIIDRNTDITTITAIDDATLDEIIYSYGGDEEVEDVAVLILNKKDLKKFAKLRDKQGRKVYTIVNHGNTGTIDEVPYIINSACAEIGGTKDAYCMAYGPLSNYEVAIFSDIEAKKSTEYKFKQGQTAYKACVFMGGNVVAKNGFIRVKNPTA